MNTKEGLKAVSISAVALIAAAAITSLFLLATSVRGEDVTSQDGPIRLASELPRQWRGAIQGVVTDTGGSPPLPDAVVQALQNSVVMGEDTTDHAGFYRIESLDPGIYDVVASVEYYLPDTVTGVSVGEGTVQLDFELFPTVPQGCLFGVITDTFGVIIQSAIAQAILDSAVVGEDTTDHTGYYRVSPLSPGIYDAVAFAQGYRPDTTTGIAIGGGCIRVDFELEAAPAQPHFIRGDADTSVTLEMSDAIFVLKYLYVPGHPDPSCRDAADANDDGILLLSDAIYVLRCLYVPGAPEPPDPYPDPGPDPTPDGLDCIFYPNP